jgi:hypothetical protein
MLHYQAMSGIVGEENLDDWLQKPMPETHNYGPRGPGERYFPINREDASVDPDLQAATDVDDECASLAYLAENMPESMDDEQKERLESVQRHRYKTKDAPNPRNILVPNNTAHGHAMRLFQELTDTSEAMQCSYTSDAHYGLFSPSMKRDFYKFCMDNSSSGHWLKSTTRLGSPLGQGYVRSANSALSFCRNEEKRIEGIKRSVGDVKVARGWER